MDIGFLRKIKNHKNYILITIQGEEFREGVLINLSDDDDSPFPDQTKGLNNQHNPSVYPAAGRRPSLHTNNQRVKQSKSVSFKDC